MHRNTTAWCFLLLSNGVQPLLNQTQLNVDSKQLHTDLSLQCTMSWKRQKLLNTTKQLQCSTSGRCTKLSPRFQGLLDSDRFRTARSQEIGVRIPGLSHFNTQFCLHIHSLLCIFLSMLDKQTVSHGYLLSHIAE